MYNAADMFIYCIEAVSVYILCLSIKPCYTSSWFPGSVCTITYKLMAVALQVAQPMQSAGGDQQPPLPTAAATASEHLWAVAAKTRAAPSHSHTVTIFTSAGSMYCPSGYLCLHLVKKGEVNSTRERETGISSEFCVTLVQQCQEKLKHSWKYINEAQSKALTELSANEQ